MHILHICTSLNTGGLETMLVDIVNEQVKTNPVSLIILNKGINEDIYNKLSKDINLYRVNRTQGSKNILHFFKFNYLIIKIKAEVIHCHGSEIIKYIYLYKQTNIYHTVHATNMSLGSLPQYDKVFAISRIVQKDLQERLNIKSTVVYNGIHLDTIIPKKYYMYDKFNVICVSRLMHQTKGQDILIKAIDILVSQKNIKNINLDLIGEGESYKYLTELVNKFKLNNYIRFLGLRNRDYIYSHINNYELLVQPSIYEGFGLTVTEGMAAKVPVLVSDIEGPLEVIDYGKYGYTFKIKDEIDCAQKIIDVMEDYNKKKIQIKCDEAYLYAKENFDIKKTAKNYITEYIII
ncbi:MAG: glycosyltransferase [Bacteroidales bacterium]|nr:glycosyltransferase [Bacteroidales bacterium]